MMIEMKISSLQTILTLFQLWVLISKNCCVNTGGNGIGGGGGVLVSAWTIPNSSSKYCFSSRSTKTSQQLQGQQRQRQPQSPFLLSSSSSSQLRSFPFVPLSLSNRNDNNDSNDDKKKSSTGGVTSTIPRVERVSIYGVTVSSDGFQVLLQCGTRGYLPVQITNDPQDANAATSPEALTMIQLLSDVDMAGSILPPDVLARMLVIQCEEEQQRVEDDNNNHGEDLSMTYQTILSMVHSSLPDSEDSYTDAHSWFQNKVWLPTVTLDQLTMVMTNEDVGDADEGVGEDEQGMIEFSLDCSLKKMGKTVSFIPTSDAFQHVSYRYQTDASHNFVSLALALRYKAPIVMQINNDNDCGKDDDENSSSKTAKKLKENEPPKKNNDNLNFLTMEQLEESFPQMTTVEKLQKSSTRVTENIERGFEIHKLSGALRIAKERGDEEAVKRIRAELDKFDSMDELLTTETKKQQQKQEEQQKEIVDQQLFWDDVDDGDILQ